MPEALTIAYIAMGAQRRMQVAVRSSESEAHQKLIDTAGGELGVIDHIIAFAGDVEKLHEKFGSDSYVFAYDVCEEFGYYAVDRMLKAESYATVDLFELARLTIVDAAQA